MVNSIASDSNCLREINRYLKIKINFTIKLRSSEIEYIDLALDSVDDNSESS